MADTIKTLTHNKWRRAGMNKSCWNCEHAIHFHPFDDDKPSPAVFCAAGSEQVYQYERSDWKVSVLPTHP